MFLSITPYDEIFKLKDNNLKRKVLYKNNCFYEIQGDSGSGYKIFRISATDPMLYLDAKNQPGQNFTE